MKLAILFPGIGYTVNKPLLYYSRKIALQYGYEVREVSYTGFDKVIKGDRESLSQAVESAIAQSNEALKDIKWSDYEDVLFISKSIGTAVAAAKAAEIEAYECSKAAYNAVTKGSEPVTKVVVRNVYFTPIAETFDYIKEQRTGIAFHGTADQYVDTLTIKNGCANKVIPLHILSDGNHSLETGDTQRDVVYVKCIMELVEEYIAAYRKDIMTMVNESLNN